MRFGQLAEFIQRNQRIILTAHETPDGDAVGSEYGFFSALRNLGKDARIINSDSTPQKFHYLDMEHVIESLEEGAEPPDNLKDWALCILDTNDIHNIGDVATAILPNVREYFIIDHHEMEGNVFAGNLIEEDASSTSEVIYELMNDLGIDIDFPCAQALYTGIVYDTGSFIYPKTTAKTLSAATQLVAMGVHPNTIYTHIYESNSISALMMQSKVMSTLELHHGRHVAVQTMLKETIEECGGKYEEADTFINIPLKSRDIRVSIFFKQNEQGLLRCSLRSKGNINVADIAQKFSGGGHKTAAGFKCRESLEKTKATVLDMLSVYFE